MIFFIFSECLDMILSSQVPDEEELEDEKYKIRIKLARYILVLL